LLERQENAGLCPPVHLIVIVLVIVLVLGSEIRRESKHFDHDYEHHFAEHEIAIGGQAEIGEWSLRSA
jgi:hypothetical protein